MPKIRYFQLLVFSGGALECLGMQCRNAIYTFQPRSEPISNFYRGIVPQLLVGIVRSFPECRNSESVSRYVDYVLEELKQLI